MDNLKKWKADPSKGEVFTPIELVNLILDKIPSDVWTNPKSTFLDPCMGTGTFLTEIVRRLVDIYGYSELDAKSRVYGYDIRIKYINKLKRRGYVNLQHKDFLCDEIKMKFDVVIGNPPYQKQVGPNKTEPIWSKFVEKSFDLCVDGGYVSLIHPSGWRNVEGKFKNIQKLLLSKHINYLEIHNEKDGMKYFNAETRFDWYIVKNVKNTNKTTSIKFQDGVTENLSLFNTDFIPNGGISFLNKLMSKENEEKVEVIYSRSDYGTDKKNTSKNKDDVFIYPVIYTVNYLSRPKLYYSSTNQNGHYGKSKVIWSNGRISSVGNFIDYKGEYALTQFAYAIVDSVENLEKIKSVLDSKLFKNLMELCAVGQLTINYKVLKMFRKDFWKEFLDENGNVREI